MAVYETTLESFTGDYTPRNSHILDADPSMGQVWNAQLRLENMLGAAYAKYENRPGKLTPQEMSNLQDGVFNYKDHIPPDLLEYESEYARFATSERHANWVTNYLRKQIADRELVSAAPVKGFIAGAGAAMISPETIPTFFIPGALLLKNGATIGSRAGVVAREAAVAASSAAVSEAVLHPLQATRTAEESVYAIAGSAIFAGVITGGIHTIRSGKKSAGEFSDDLDDELFNTDSNPDFAVVDDILRHAGAAETSHARAAGPMDETAAQTHARLVAEHEARIKAAEEAGDAKSVEFYSENLKLLNSTRPEDIDKLKRSWVAKVFGFANPDARMALATSPTARKLAALVSEGSLTRMRNVFGDSLPPSLTTQVTQIVQEQMHKTISSLMENYKAYNEQMAKSGAKSTSYEEFSKKVSEYIREGKGLVKDGSGDDFLHRAAIDVTNNVLQPFEMRLDNMDMLPRDVVDYAPLTRDEVEGITMKLQDADADFSLNADDFFTKVTDADGNVEYVQKANISRLPQEVINEAILAGVLDTKLVIPEGDAAYLHRLWNFDALRADPQGFIDRVTEHLVEQANKQDFDATTRPVQEKIDVVDEKITSLEQRIEAQRTKNKARHEANRETPEQAAERRAETERKRKQHAKWKEEGKVDTPFQPPRRTLQQEYNDAVHLRKQLDEVMEARLAEVSALKDSIPTDAAEAAFNMYEGLIATQFNPHLKHQSKAFQVGPLKTRVINLPSSVIGDYLENDLEKITLHYFQSIAPQLATNELFAPGTPSPIRTGNRSQNEGMEEFRRHLTQVDNEYSELRKQALAKGDTKEHNRLLKEQKDVVRDLNAVVEINFGRYKVPDNPDGFWNQFFDRLKEFNVITMLGQVTAASFSDVGHTIMRHGMKPFTTEMVRFAEDMKVAIADAEQAKLWGMSADINNASRIEAMGLTDDNMRPMGDSKAMKAWNNTRSMFNTLSVMPTWNNSMKSTTALTYFHEVSAAAVKFLNGKLDPDDLEALARAGFGRNDLEAIGRNITAADFHDGIYHPNLDKWADQALANRFKANVRREVNTTIVTPGAGDLPLWIRTKGGSVVGQFKSFPLAANSKILMASLDDMSAQKVAGMLTMVMLGYTSYATKQYIKGQPIETDYDTIIREGLDRSGLMAFWGDINAMLSKATAGEADIARLFGAEKAVGTRYAARNISGAAFGISAGRIQDLAQIIRGLSTGEFSESDARAIRRAIPMNNLWMLHRAFNQLETAMKGAMQ